MSASQKYFSGKTLEQALIAAAKEFGLESDEIAYVQFEKRGGALRGRKRVVITVDPAAPRKGDTPPPKAVPTKAAPPAEPPAEPVIERHASPELEAPEEAPRAARERDQPRREPRRARREPERVEEEREDEEVAEEVSLHPVEGPEQEIVQEALGRILAVSGLEVTAALSQGEERLHVDLSGEDADLLTEEHGKALFAIEHLLPKVARGLGHDRAFFFVDCDGFRAQREDELRQLAADAAEKVRETGEEEELGPLNPAERRIVHLALVDAEDVGTESEGRGYLKRLYVFPT